MADLTEHPAESLEQLRVLGIPVKVLEESLMDGRHGKASAGPLHPRWFAGSHQYADIIQGLRLRLAAEGWTPSEDHGLATVVSPDGLFQITVSSGDERVGTSASPRTKNPKGGATRLAVAVNAAQEKLFASLPTFINPRKQQKPTGLKTWFLLHHEWPDRIEFELALPSSMGSDGRPNDWAVRLKFAPILLGPTSNQTPPMYDVDVSRR